MDRGFIGQFLQEYAAVLLLLFFLSSIRILHSKRCPINLLVMVRSDFLRQFVDSELSMQCNFRIWNATNLNELTEKKKVYKCLKPFCVKDFVHVSNIRIYLVYTYIIQ